MNKGIDARDGSRQMTEEELLAFIAEIEQQDMIKAPVGLKQQIMEKTKRPDVQLVIKTQEINKGMQFFFYSLKIGAAAAMALFLLFWMPQDFSMPDLASSRQSQWEMRSRETLAERLDKKADAVTGRIAQMAEQWMNKEDEADD